MSEERKRNKEGNERKMGGEGGKERGENEKERNVVGRAPCSAGNF